MLQQIHHIQTVQQFLQIPLFQSSAFLTRKKDMKTKMQDIRWREENKDTKREEVTASAGNTDATMGHVEDQLFTFASFLTIDF